VCHAVACVSVCVCAPVLVVVPVPVVWCDRQLTGADWVHDARDCVRARCVRVAVVIVCVRACVPACVRRANRFQRDSMDTDGRPRPSASTRDSMYAVRVSADLTAEAAARELVSALEAAKPTSVPVDESAVRQSQARKSNKKKGTTTTTSKKKKKKKKKTQQGGATTAKRKAKKVTTRKKTTYRRSPVTRHGRRTTASRSRSRSRSRSQSRSRRSWDSDRVLRSSVASQRSMRSSQRSQPRRRRTRRVQYSVAAQDLYASDDGYVACVACVLCVVLLLGCEPCLLCSSSFLLFVFLGAALCVGCVVR